MRVFVHMVGESATGLESSGYKDVTFTSARERAVSAWCDQAEALVDDPTALAQFLRESRRLTADGQLVADAGGRPLPLVGLLATVDPDDEVELLLVGTDNPQGVPSLRLAETLGRLFERHSRLLGPEVLVRVVATKFDLDHVADVAREALRVEEPAGSPSVEIIWGPGSTELSLGIMSGVITTGRPWLLRRADGQFDQIRVLSELGYPAVVSWLLRYGYPDRIPDALAESGADAPELLRIGQQTAASLRAVATGRSDPATLATWVHTEVRRMNRTAGLAVRAWMTAEYRRRCRAEGRPDATEVLSRLGIFELGRVIWAINNPGGGRWSSRRHVLRQVAASESGQWLLARDDLNERASKSAHEFKALNPASLHILRADVGAAGAVPVTPECGPFHFPSGAVGYLWAEGRTRPTGREAAIDTVLGNPPPAELLGLVPRREVAGYSRHIVVDLLILASTQAMPYAQEQMQKATENAGNRRSPYQFVQPVAPPQQVEINAADGKTLDSAEADARSAADSWLRERDLDAIVIVPSGPKEQATGLLTAALDYGHRRAVPVFVQSLQDDGPARFHRFLPYLTTNAPVLELARNTLRDLAFDTAIALIGLCRAADPADADGLEALKVQLKELRDCFFASDKRAARERVTLCAKLANGAETVDQIRLVHVAAELYRLYGPGRTGAGAQLGAIRNRLGINHGGRSLDEALRVATTNLKVPVLTAASLIFASAQQMAPSPAHESAPIRRYDMIVSALDKLIGHAKAAQNHPIDRIVGAS